MRGRPKKPVEQTAEFQVKCAITEGRRTYKDIEDATRLSKSSVRAATRKLLNQGEITRTYVKKEVSDLFGEFKHQHEEPVFGLACQI